LKTPDILNKQEDGGEEEMHDEDSRCTRLRGRGGEGEEAKTSPRFVAG